MSLEIHMPQVASDMTGADVVAWLVEPGESVRQGDVLLEIETEKSTVEIEAPATGTLREILVAAGTTDVAVGTLLAVLDTADAEKSADAPEPAGVKDAAPQPPATVPAPAAAAAAAAGNRAEHGAATALARRLATQAGIDLARVDGTGPRGRITRHDVEQRIASAVAPREEGRTAATGGPALLQLTAICRIDGLLGDLDRLNALAAGGPAIGPLHTVVRAAALSLREITARDGGNAANGAADVAIGVATKAGLALPVLRAADTKSLGTIAAEVEALVGLARDGGLASGDEHGAEIAVLDLGVTGIDGVRVVSSAPRRLVVGVGAPRAEPVVDDGEVVPGTTLTLTLSADRTAVTEMAAAELLASIRRAVERPVSMLL